eukprot:scaffold155071_cov16-Tisochrysis_lutea.AAC.1
MGSCMRLHFLFTAAACIKQKRGKELRVCVFTCLCTAIGLLHRGVAPKRAGPSHAETGAGVVGAARLPQGAW